MLPETPKEIPDVVEEKERQEKMNKPVVERLVGTIFLQTKPESDLAEALRGVKGTYLEKNIRADWTAIQTKAVGAMKAETFSAIKRDYIGENMNEMGKRILIFEPRTGERIIYCSALPTVWLHVRNGNISGNRELAAPIPLSDYGVAVTWFFQQLQAAIEQKTVSPGLKEKTGKERREHMYAKLRVMLQLVAMTEEGAKKFLEFEKIETGSEAYVKAVNLLLHRQALRESLIGEFGEEKFKRVAKSWLSAENSILLRYEEHRDFGEFQMKGGVIKIDIHDDATITGHDMRMDRTAYFLDDVQKAARYIYWRYSER